jgi:DNA invertase Pin-like site-specific DNA recombinase
MRVALYTRVSTDRQEVENQLIALRAWCNAAGHAITAEFIDEGFSATTAKRPAFQRMLTAAHRREFDMLLFWSLDRLSREGALETLKHLEKLGAWGIAWRSYTEQFFDSCGPFKDAIIAFIGTVAKLERVKISERTKAGLVRAKLAGKTLGRPKLEGARAKILWLKAKEPLISIRQLAARVGVSKATVERTLLRQREPAR